MAAPAPANPARELRPSEVADPLEARKLAERQEQRASFEAMRDGFAGSQRESAASRARLEPALRALWPAMPPTFGATCRERLCRVEVPGGAPEARAALVADAGVRRVADGVFVDPDDRDPIAYVMLVSPGASPGEDLLSGVEREFFLSSDGRECLSSAGAVGSVEYELRVDTSGFTYRSRTDLPRPVLECVNEALDGIIATTEVPRGEVGLPHLRAPPLTGSPCAPRRRLSPRSSPSWPPRRPGPSISVRVNTPASAST